MSESEPSRAVQTAANAIGYALEQEGLTVPPEAALRAAQRLREQGLLLHRLTAADEAEDTW